ncbi:MAG: histidinol-phosphate transaminase [Calditerrivibrio sp.]|nr:histidinol-phosphate transaminase [Calditerrivibrio sp.]MCA1932278.1 histidinol-phosphate transaminase [Calditerrivibrio sp.]
MIDYKKLAGEKINSLIPYQPGKPIKELERELGIKEAIKLASNENPLGVSEKVIKAVTEALHEMNRYPLGDAFYLRQELSHFLNVDPARIIFGTGSNEIIELAIRTFVKPGEHVMSYAPSFSVYGIIAQANGNSCKWIPTKERFKVDFEKLKDAIEDTTRIIFLANPNNPTGVYFNSDELTDFLNFVPKETIVMLDEAYIEYVDAADFPDSLKLIDKYPNVMTMRTFSKAYGLAGFRIGYAVGNIEGIDMLNRVRQPFNVNMVAQIAAIAAIEDKEFVRRSIKVNREGKVYLYKAFKELGLDYIETQANFILVNVGDGKKVFDNLLKEGVIVRFLGPALKEYVRVSIGTQEENQIFVNKLKKILSKG